MSKKLLIILLAFFILIGVFFVTSKKSLPLINPVFKQNISEQPTPLPSSYNPPKEIKYNSSTDLKKELETIDPQVLESDFENL